MFIIRKLTICRRHHCPKFRHFFRDHFSCWFYIVQMIFCFICIQSCLFLQMSCKAIAFLICSKWLRLSEINNLSLRVAKGQKSSSCIFLKNFYKCFCFIFTRRLTVNLFSSVVLCREIFSQIYPSAVTDKFFAWNLLHSQHLSINRIPDRIEIFLINFISIRIQKWNKTDFPVFQ